MRILFRLQLLLPFFIGVSFFMQSQVDNTVDFQHIKNGMPQNSATVLFEDSLGFLWVGTPSGVNKYNGKHFESFEKPQDSISAGYVNVFYEHQSNIYIGTNQGLSVYNRNLNQTMPFEFSEAAKELEFQSIRTIAKTDSLLWLGTFANGLYRYNLNNGTVKQFLVNQKLIVNGAPDNFVVKIAPLSNGRLLVISSFRILVLDRELNVLNEYTSDDFLNAAAETSGATSFLVGTGNGVLMQVQVQPNSELQISQRSISPGFPVLSLAQDAKNNIWVGTENNGLFIYSKETDKVRHYKLNPLSATSIASNSIGSILQTRDRVMWLVPYKRGLSFYDEQYHKFTHVNSHPFFANTLSNPVVNSFIEDKDGNLWVGTDGGGLNYWNKATDTFESYALDKNNFGSNYILSIFQKERDELWVGTWSNGIVLFNTKDKTYKNWNTSNSFLRSNNISDIFQDSKGRIWIANLFGGLQYYNPVTKAHQDIKITSELDGAEIQSVYKLTEDLDGNIWVGTQSSGAFKLQENSKGWTSTQYHNVGENRTLSSDFVNTVFRDSKGTIWIGTQIGLNKYNKETDAFDVITKRDGIVNNTVKAIIEDADGKLWLSTNGGITQYNTSTGETLNYSKKDGLQDNEFNSSAAFKTKEGEYVFGGVNGFNIFKPAEIKKRTDIPEIFISEFTVFNKPVLPNDDFGILKKDISRVDSVQLNYDHSVINISFNALTFRHAEAVNYAYFLEGFEKDWNYVGDKSSVTYTNLNPGSYKFRIKSTNSDGVWVENEKQLHLFIKPPFWKTNWFIFTVIALSLLVISVLYYLKTRSIRKRQEELERLIALRTNELERKKDKLATIADELSIKNEEIQRFTFAVSHDLQGPLNNIKSITGLISNEVEKNASPNLKKYLHFIDVCYDLMHKLIADISKIAKLGKIENVYELLNTNEIIDLATIMISNKLDMQQVEFQIDENLPAIYGDKKRMTQVFGNFMDNAVKYMGNQQNPKIIISYKDNGDFNSFLIKDNGSGLNDEALDKLFTPFERFHAHVKGTGLGLYMIQQIAMSHGGKIAATSDGEGKGTTFSLFLPKAHVFEQQVSKKKELG